MRKTLLIVAVLLVFVFGIFGIPKGVGLSAWKTAMTDRIRLGLDLKGGIHLVLQVMVQEAQISASQAQVEQAQAAVTFSLQQAARYKDLAERQYGTVQMEQQTASNLRKDQAALKNEQAALTLAQRAVFMEKGQVRFEGGCVVAQIGELDERTCQGMPVIDHPNRKNSRSRCRVRVGFRYDFEW